MSDEVLLSRRDGDLLWLTLNRPERANALSPDLIQRLTEVYGQDWRAQGVRAILLDGAGRHFSAGADLDHLRSLRDTGLRQNRSDSAALRGLFEAVLRQETLTVALVHGACVAGGCGLATAHDLVVTTADARFLYSEVRIGFVAALVATFLPLRLRGRDIRRVLLNPEPLPAEEAMEIGLVDRLVAEGEDPRAAGERMVDAVLRNASGESIARTKRLLLELLGRPLSERLDLAQEANAQARLTDDCRRGIEHFLEHKKTPDWRG
ncbi:MAG: enoyl-CoA hydratase/isomerase family protein [Thermoanaerobaculia bacterium]